MTFPFLFVSLVTVEPEPSDLMVLVSVVDLPLASVVVVVVLVVPDLPVVEVVSVVFTTFPVKPYHFYQNSQHQPLGSSPKKTEMDNNLQLRKLLTSVNCVV